MKLVYMAQTCFGEFYYDVNTHEGVAIHPDGIHTVLGMKEDYDPRGERGVQEIEVDEKIYQRLKDRVSRHLGMRIELRRSEADLLSLLRCLPVSTFAQMFREELPDKGI